MYFFLFAFLQFLVSNLVKSEVWKSKIKVMSHPFRRKGTTKWSFHTGHRRELGVDLLPWLNSRGCESEVAGRPVGRVASASASDFGATDYGASNFKLRNQISYIQSSIFELRG
jgi:hypothetical protein